MMILLAEVFKRVLVEGRKEDTLKRYPGREAEIEVLSNADPSETNKYLDWGMKQFVSNENVKPEAIAEVIKLFHSRLKTLKNKDIYSYSFLDLVDLLSKGGNSKREERKFEKGRADIVFKNNRWLLVHPHETSAACFYGKGTKWCTSSTKDNQFENYAFKNEFIYYLIDKEAPNQSKYSKFGTAYSIPIDVETDEPTKEPGDIDWMDTEDNVVPYSVMKQILGAELFERITDIIHENSVDEKETAIKKQVKGARFLKDPEKITQLWNRFSSHDQLVIELARNPNTPPDILDKIFDKNEAFMWYLSQNPKLPSKVRTKFRYAISRSKEPTKMVTTSSPNADLVEAAIVVLQRELYELPEDDVNRSWYETNIESYSKTLESLNRSRT